MDTGDSVSVIIPSRLEGSRLLEAVRAARLAIDDAEFLVVAHGESSETREAVLAEGIQWIEAPRACRGLQLKLGGEKARCRNLVFLHADTRLPPGAGRLVSTALSREGVAGGAFRVRFEQRHLALRLMSMLSRLSLPTSFVGDQCLFCTQKAYRAAGGFCEHPLFEDVDLARRLARVGKLVRLPQYVTTSERRFLRTGRFRQVTVNMLLMSAYHLGARPQQLSNLYHGMDGESPALEGGSEIQASRPKLRRVPDDSRRPRGDE